MKTIAEKAVYSKYPQDKVVWIDENTLTTYMGLLTKYTKLLEEVYDPDQKVKNIIYYYTVKGQEINTSIINYVNILVEPTTDKILGVFLTDEVICRSCPERTYIERYL